MTITANESERKRVVSNNWLWKFNLKLFKGDYVKCLESKGLDRCNEVPEGDNRNSTDQKSNSICIDRNPQVGS